MSNNDIDLMKEKLIALKKINPLKFERFKGRLDALVEAENEKSVLKNEVKKEKN